MSGPPPGVCGERGCEAVTVGLTPALAPPSPTSPRPDAGARSPQVQKQRPNARAQRPWPSKAARPASHLIFPDDGRAGPPRAHTELEGLGA